MFSERLEEIKRTKHLKSKDIAEDLNLATSTLTKWTQGAYPNSELLKKF